MSFIKSEQEIENEVMEFKSIYLLTGDVTRHILIDHGWWYCQG